MRIIHSHYAIWDIAFQILNNYWMRLSMIARIIKPKFCVICRNRSLRRITQTKAFIILTIMRKPNSIIVLLYRYTIIQLYYYTIIQLYNYTIIQLYNYTITQLYYYKCKSL